MNHCVMLKSVAVFRYYKRCLVASLLVLIGIHVTAKLTKTAVIALAPTWQRNRTETTAARRSAESQSYSSALNVVLPGSSHARNETFNCITARVTSLRIPICLYAAAIDVYVSATMVRGGYFETDAVSRFLRLLQRDRRLQFVDIGANIGVYSLPVARVTRVLAVEPNWRSLVRLAKAADLGAVRSNITLVHNAVSDVRDAFNMGVDKTNQGHAFLINTTECTSTLDGTPCSTLSQTKTVFLNDLLPLMRSTAALLKVDVEGHEVSVFTEPTAGQFFDQIDVPLVFMEWMWCRKLSQKTVQRLLDFFKIRNYVAFGTRNNRLRKHYRKWPANVLFKKLSYNFRF